MDIISILSRVASGLAVKAAACALACYAAGQVWGYVAHVFSTVKGVGM